MTGSGCIWSFGKVLRLTKPDEFTSVLRYNRSLAGEYFVVYAKPNLRTGPRLGIIVTKKTEPKAVSRNFAKRVIREVFRRHQGSIPALDVVVRLAKPVSRSAAPQAQKELIRLLAGLQ